MSSKKNAENQPRGYGFRVAPGERFDLDAIDPRHDDAPDGTDWKRAAGEARLADNHLRLNELQRRLYAGNRHGLLIVLQGMDTAGKDGLIRHVLGAFNPQGVRVVPFKVPTEEELAHDFLWRVHRHTPRRGRVSVFNRSHYEDVLVVRVKQLVPDPVWQARYDHINAFEKLLTDSGVTVVKLFLHISPEEQGDRLRKRQINPDKHWKFSPGDLEDRKLWPRFRHAYEEALTRCNTPWAPWWVVPADKKWYRNLCASEILLEVLEGLDLEYPKPIEALESYVIPEVY
ncbi:MAG: polyphosphate kinase 2 family protein [Acidobacteriota bacterium]